MNQQPVRKLIIDDYPQLVLPRLAVALGLKEAIFLQQLHYWINKSKNQHDNRYWVYNTIEEWKEQLPYLSGSTIRRIINALRDQDILIATDKYNRSKTDRRLWYTIDYALVEGLCENVPMVETPIEEPVEDDPSMSGLPNDEEVNLTINADTESQDIENTMQSLADSIGSVMDNIASHTPVAQNGQVELLRMDKSSCSKWANGVDQNEQVELSKVSNSIDQNEQMELPKMSKSTIYTKTTPETPSETSDNDNAETEKSNAVVVLNSPLKSSLIDHGIQELIVDQWLTKYEEAYVQEKLDLMEATANRKGVANAVGFLVKAIKDDWKAAPKFNPEKMDPSMLSQDERRAKYIPDEFKHIIRG